MPTDPFKKIIESAQTAAEALTGKACTQPEVLAAYAHSFAERGLLFGFARFNPTTQCWNLSEIALAEEADSWPTWTGDNLNADYVPAAQVEAFNQALEQQQPVFFDRSMAVLAPFFMRPYAEDEEYPPSLSLPGFVAPVTTAEEIFGALVCAGERLSTENLPALQIVARELTLRLENARLRAMYPSQRGEQTLALTSISEAVHLFDDVKSPILALNHDWEILYCNQAYAAFVKRPKDQLIGENLLALFPGFESRPSFQTYQLALQTGDVHILEGRAPNHNFLRAQIIPAPWGLLAIAEDITEERRSQAALAESEQRYRTLFEASNDAIFLTAESGDILDCNLRACSMSGYSKDELLKMQFHQLFQAPEGFSLALAEQRTLEEKNLEIHILPKDDHRFPAEANVRQ
ncbi:MAG TPA: PAS domain-containing protein, partial [Anaerolineales bacterium]|nr:PAS domain-containing protein [Anaerolineales bacterium]